MVKVSVLSSIMEAVMGSVLGLIMEPVMVSATFSHNSDQIFDGSEASVSSILT